jgi:outer membrane immunogenic protein
MKFLYVLATLLCTAGFSPAVAQVSEGSRAEVALGYTYLHSNAPPSGCGCFSWNGGLVSAAWHFNSKLSLAGEFGGAHASKLASSSLSPTITTFLAGPRYTFGVRQRHIAPFAQILLGGAHSIGGYYPSGATSSGTATGFAMTAGGGFDLPLSGTSSFAPSKPNIL